MLKDVLNSDRFASLENLKFLLEEVLSYDHPRSIKDIAIFCEEKSVIFATSLEASLSLLEYLSLVNRDSDNKFSKIEDPFSGINIIDFVIQRLFSQMSKDKIISDFISPEAIEFDSINDKICIRNNYVPLDFSGLKNFLISIKFLRKSILSENLYEISGEYQSLFQNSMIPSIKEEKFSGIHCKNLSLASLMRIQELNESHGKEAEEFVLSYEKSRINSSLAKKIRIISDIQCDAGYDIASFSNNNSKQIDRFIEVKSYSGEPYFYWSRNEVAISEIKQDKYFMYLVNRQMMDKPGYAPLVIQNPYKNIFLNEKVWDRNVMSWYFSK
jgi:hypothetical protein